MKLNLMKRPAILKFQDDERARRYLDLKETDKATHNEEKMSNLKMDVSNLTTGSSRAPKVTAVPKISRDNSFNFCKIDKHWNI